MAWQEWRDRRRFADWRMGIRTAEDDFDEEVDFG